MLGCKLSGSVCFFTRKIWRITKNARFLPKGGCVKEGGSETLRQDVNSVINENEIKLLDNGSSRAIRKKQLHILTAYYIMNVHLSVLYI